VGDGVGLRHRGLEGSALSRVPEHLVVEAKVETKRVKRPMSQHGQRREQNEKDRAEGE